MYALGEWPFLFVVTIWKFRQAKQVLYFCELCWVVNLFGWAVLIAEAIAASSGNEPLSDDARLTLGRVFFSFANGPLALSVLLLHNALVFHDPVRTSGFFIHFTPALVSWTFRWNFKGHDGCDEGSNSHWTRCIFAAHRSDDLRAQASGLYAAPIVVYLIWWVPYTIWLLVIGYDLPNRGWGASSFHDNIPAIQSVLRVPPTRPRAQALAYCVGHLLACFAALTLPLLLYNFFAVHTTFLALLLLLAVYNGANYYYYSTGPKLAKAIRQTLQADLAVPGPAKGQEGKVRLTADVDPPPMPDMP